MTPIIIHYCRSFWSFLAVVCVALPVRAQTHFEKVAALGLSSVTERDVVAYYSKGYEHRARIFATFVANMIDFYAAKYGDVVKPSLAILSEGDWRATMENPYGVPGVRQPGSIAFMPADVERGAVYHDVVALRKKMSQETRRDIEAVCGSLERCAAHGADGIVAHEVAHLYEVPAGIGKPAIWFGEFVTDYLTYAYLRERQPPQFRPFMLIHRVSVTAPPQFKSFDEFEEHIADAVPAELGRLHAFFLERIEQVYERHRLGFVDRLAAAFPRPTTRDQCAIGGAKAGFCESERLSNEEILKRLDAIEPGFTSWAASLGRARR